MNVLGGGQKLKAVELLIKYDMSPASVIRGLGYPSRVALKSWYRQCRDNGDDIPDANNYRHYSDEQKRIAVEHFFEHGQCLALTIRALGYPSKELLASWVDELAPGRRPKRAAPSKISTAVKERAVVDLVTRKGSAKEVSDALGVERVIP